MGGPRIMGSVAGFSKGWGFGWAGGCPFPPKRAGAGPKLVGRLMGYLKVFRPLRYFIGFGLKGRACLSYPDR